MAIGDALIAPTGVQNQMVGQPSRVPGYDQGYAQAPGMPRPTQPNPMGRPTAVVGGPAYFTPEGYNAPPQPTQAFMPTDRAPDPIGQQFMRQMQSPMGQQYQQQYEAIQAPMREAEMAQRAEQQAAQDARFQEMMDRIAELEGQVAASTPTEPTAPIPGDVDPYIPGGTFPGIPDFIRDLDFSGLPDFSGIDFSDYDLGALGPIIDQYNERMEMGEPEPIDTFIEEAMRDQYMTDEMPDPRDLPPASVGGPGGPPPVYSVSGLAGTSATMPDYGYDNPSFRDAGAMPPENNFFVDGDGNLNVGDGIIRTMGSGPRQPVNFDPPGQYDYTGLSGDIDIPPSTTTGPLTGTFGNFGPFTPPPVNPYNQLPTTESMPPAPVMPEPNSFFPGVIPDFSNIDFSNIDFSNLPKAGGSPSSAGMDFSNLRNFNLR